MEEQVPANNLAVEEEGFARGSLAEAEAVAEAETVNDSRLRFASHREVNYLKWLVMKILFPTTSSPSVSCTNWAKVTVSTRKT
jgi:hypothetical protein